jgi:hypothetical protein
VSPEAADSPRKRPIELSQEQFDEAAAELLARKFCSSAWLMDSFEVCWRGPGHAFFRFIPGVYPPGGKLTRMVRCSDCGRLSPRPADQSELCLDCQDGRFIERIERYRRNYTFRRWLYPGLAARWWRSREPLDQVVQNPASLFGTHSAFEVAGRVDDPAVEQATEEQIFAGEKLVTSDQPVSPRRRSLSRQQVIAAVDRLFDSKPSPGRVPGSKLVVLNETYRSLRREIEYYERMLKSFGGQVPAREPERLVIPSARRIDNPYLPDLPYRKPGGRRKRRRKPAHTYFHTWPSYMAIHGTRPPKTSHKRHT